MKFHKILRIRLRTKRIVRMYKNVVFHSIKGNFVLI